MTEKHCYEFFDRINRIDIALIFSRKGAKALLRFFISCFNPDYALKKVARAFLPVMPIIAGRNARTTFLLP